MKLSKQHDSKMNGDAFKSVIYNTLKFQTSLKL